MGIRTWRHRGRKRLVLSKVWPDGTRFRSFMPNKTVAKEMERTIDYAVITGKWRELREEFGKRGSQSERNPTLSEFGEEYLNYCRSRNRDIAFKERQVGHLVTALGNVELGEWRRRHADQFVDSRRRQGVSNATINRGLAVLKNMMTIAVEREYISTHPLIRYRLLPEVEEALRVMTYAEYRLLAEAVCKEDIVIGAYTVFLGETGARKQEGLNLKWGQVDLSRGIVSIGRTKSGKRRSVPLSDLIVEALGKLVRFIGLPHVFIDPARRKHWKDPRGPFQKARSVAGLDWVSFHDLRHFRATQWLMHGVDVNTLRGLLGHSTIQTTMRYVHYLQSHAAESVAQAQKNELKLWQESETKVATKWIQSQ